MIPDPLNRKHRNRAFAASLLFLALWFTDVFFLQNQILGSSKGYIFSAFAFLAGWNTAALDANLSNLTKRFDQLVEIDRKEDRDGHDEK